MKLSTALAFLVFTIVLSGCADMRASQQQALSRGAVRPGGVALPVGRSVGPDGVRCSYSDGTSTTSGNRGALC